MFDFVRRASGTRPLSHVFIGLLIAAGLETALLAACAGSANEPRKVAREFWTAMGNQDVAKARSLATRATAGTIQVQTSGGPQHFRFELGKAKKHGQTAVVETVVMERSGGREFPIAVRTALVREEGAWRVNADQTFQSLFGAAFAAASEEAPRR